MKKSLLALAFATAGLMAAPAVFAQSAPNGNGGWFVNGVGWQGENGEGLSLV